MVDIARFAQSLQMSLQRGINFRALAEKMGNCSGAEGECSTSIYNAGAMTDSLDLSTLPYLALFAVRGICTEAGECP